MTSEQPGQLSPGARTYDPGEDRPGDPACLLRRVCPACGSVADEDPPTTCPACHADMPGT
jgi:rubrerythrin